MKSLISHSHDSWNPSAHRPLQDWVSTVSAQFSYLVQHLTESLLSTPELRIWKGKTRSGEPYWNLYDPMTGNHARLYSQEEVRIWIEERYYH